MVDTSISRRIFLRSAAAATTLASTSFAQSAATMPNAQDAVQLSQIHGPSEEDEQAPGPFLAGDQRIGFAIVGLGRLSIDQILPAFGHSKYAKVTALVSGDHEKATKIAAQYGVNASSVYGYADFERLKENSEVKVIYIVLPNSLHAE